jgi:hypothetical protein
MTASIPWLQSDLNFSWIEIWFVRLFQNKTLVTLSETIFCFWTSKTFAVILKTVASGNSMRSNTSRPSYTYDKFSNKPYLITEHCSFWSTVCYSTCHVTTTPKGTKCYSLKTIVSRTLIQTLFPRALLTLTDTKQTNFLLEQETSTNTTVHVCGRFS